MAIFPLVANQLHQRSRAYLLFCIFFASKFFSLETTVRKIRDKRGGEYVSGLLSSTLTDLKITNGIRRKAYNLNNPVQAKRSSGYE